MRLGLVSTYPPLRCAIGLYAQNLSRALVQRYPDVSVVVAAERGSEQEPDRGVRIDCHPCYGRDEPYGDAIENVLEAAGCDVVHFQYAPDMFGEDERLPNLLAALKRRGMRTIVTLHTVQDAGRARRLLFKPSTPSFHRALARSSDRIVVHHREGSATLLEEQGIPADKVAVIPHGTAGLTLPTRAEARRLLELPDDAFVFTFFGFIHGKKNVHTVVEAFTRIAERHPRALLFVIGMPWGDRWYNHLYVGAMKARVAVAHLSDRILIRDRYVAPEHVPHVYAASDVLLLPHNQRYGSASGVFHQAIGSGLPVICAQGPKFVDAGKLLQRVPELSVPAGSIGRWAEAMDCVLRDPTLLDRGVRAVEEYAKSTAWPNIAREHRALYDSVRNGG